MRYISLLRGINVSGQNKILMTDLKALYISLGFCDVLTYIQSGNVIFTSELKEDEIVTLIEKVISKKHGFFVPVQVREVQVFANLIAKCPFVELDLVEEGTRVLVTFLSSVPSEEHVAKLMSYVKEPERLVLVGREVYLYCPHGYGKTKLSNVFIEKKLGVSVTTRNWKSVLKLHEMGL